MCLIVPIQNLVSFLININEGHSKSKVSLTFPLLHASASLTASLYSHLLFICVTLKCITKLTIPPSVRLVMCL